jgi:hypothetical protein
MKQLATARLEPFFREIIYYDDYRYNALNFG